MIRAQGGEPGSGGQKVEMENTSLAQPGDEMHVMAQAKI